MTLFYLDSSAWVKRYVQERGSGWIHGLFDANERVASVSLGYVEAVAALSRRLSERDFVRLDAQLKADWQNMMRLQVTGEIIDEAADLARRYRLRGADAIHLAATLSIHNMLSEAGQSVILVASDRELLDAGRKAGISAEDPASPSV